MRYTAELNSSLFYSWRVFRKCWDILTLGKTKWFLFLLLVGLFWVPYFLVANLAPEILRYCSLPRVVPPPDVPADILSTRDFLVKGDPPLTQALLCYWIVGDTFFLLVRVMIAASAVSFMGAWLRGKGGIDKTESNFDAGGVRQELGTRTVVVIMICLVAAVLLGHFTISQWFAPYLPIG